MRFAWDILRKLSLCPKMPSKKRSQKSVKKLVDFWPTLGPFSDPKKLYFFVVIFSETLILAETSLKNRRMGLTACFYNSAKKIFKFELSPAREAENAIFDFLKKSTWFKHEKLKIAVLPAWEHNFCDVAPVQKYWKKKHMFFENCIFPCKYAHLLCQGLPQEWKTVAVLGLPSARGGPGPTGGAHKGGPEACGPRLP